MANIQDIIRKKGLSKKERDYIHKVVGMIARQYKEALKRLSKE